MKKYKSWKSRLFDAVVVLLLIILGLSCLVPLLHVLALSLSSKNAAISGKVYLWPEELTFTPYKMLITDNRYLRALAVSLERVFL